MLNGDQTEVGGFRKTYSMHRTVNKCIWYLEATWNVCSVPVHIYPLSRRSAIVQLELWLTAYRKRMVRFLAGSRLFPLTTTSIQVLKPTEPPIQRISHAVSPGIVTGHNMYYSPLSDAKIKKSWKYVSTSPYISIVWCGIKHTTITNSKGLSLYLRSGHLRSYSSISQYFMETNSSYSVHNSPPLVPILNHSNWVPTTPSYVSKVNLNIIFPSKSVSS